VLAGLLDKYLGPRNSVLAEGLARQVGEASPLFRKLSLTESDGLVKVLEGQLRAVMGGGTPSSCAPSIDHGEGATTRTRS
jgi:hypothetical protein